MEEFLKGLFVNIEDTIQIYSRTGKKLYSNHMIRPDQKLLSRKKIKIGDKDLVMVTYSNKKMNELDPLTGVLTKESFLDEIKKCDPAYSYVIVFCDIDNFKNINETYGHIEADKVIKGTASIIKSNIRQTDLIGRFGGDEFVILMKNLDVSLSYNRINAIRKLINDKNYRLKNINSSLLEDVSVSMTFGLVEIKNDIENSLQNADELLIKGKHKEKNKVYILKK